MKAWPRVISGLTWLTEHPHIAAGMVFNGQSYFPTPELEAKHWETLLEGLDDAHIFEFDDDTVRLMELTDNDPHDVRLPFPLTFLDAEFSVSSGKTTNHYAGILLYEYDPNLTPEEEVHRFEAEHQAAAAKYKGRGLVLDALVKTERHVSAIAFIRDSGKPYVVDVFYPISHDPRKLYEKTMGTAAGLVTMRRYGVAEWTAIRNIALNFLDLLKTPDAYVVPMRRGAKNAARRKREGKEALPPSDVVWLRPSIRRYIAGLKASAEWNVSHRFWVRGHFRHYRDERYRDVVAHDRTHAERTGNDPRVGACDSCFGVEFIKPFVKGRGLLVKKRYREPERS